MGEAAPGDVIVLDAPIGGSPTTALDALVCGDVPGIAMVAVDGEIQIPENRVSPPRRRTVTLG